MLPVKLRAKLGADEIREVMQDKPRRAKVRLAVPVVTEQIGRLGQVFWLRHPMQETFERAVDGE